MSAGLRLDADCLYGRHRFCDNAAWAGDDTLDQVPCECPCHNEPA